MMDSAQLRKLIKQEEGAKLDFKIKLHEIYDADRNRQWDELIKDILSITNGNIGTAGETGYLIIGAGDNLKPNGTRDLLDVGTVRLSRQQLLDKVNSACEPEIPDIQCQRVTLDTKDLLVISVPPTPYIHKLRKQLKTPKKEFSPHTVLIRRKDGEKIYEASDQEKEALRTEKEKWWSSGSHPTNSETSDSIDALVGEVRSHCCQAILDSYSKIRLPDDTRIDVDLLYVDVYVLEKLSSKRYASISGLLEGVEQRQDYERLALGQRQKRLPGQEIVGQSRRLMLLGKPGSGKTTFLRHLAVDCSKGKFFCDRIPVLIELRSIKEGNSFNLLNLIHREFGLAEQEQTQQILNLGKAFILLDGLDEVASQLRQSVRDQIYEFAKEYRKNCFVLTCRTQTIEYIADHFEPIEVANFDAQQVKIFARNWFTASPETSGEAEGWTSRFVGKLEENKQIRELAVTPILLTLTCLLFTAEQDLPKKRSELYEKGSNLLLQQWDRFREIPRDYQQISVSDKQKLLSYLAFRKFEQPGNFILFEQNEIQGYIAEHLGIDVEESEALLEAIEAHHGLLIERAQGLWSFSHLTFHEYFTARKIVMSCNPYAVDDPTLQGLVSHLTEKRWREVFLLAVGMLDSADVLLRLIKARIDELLAEDEKMQQFLRWVDEKAQSVDVSYKTAAVRGFYLALQFENNVIIAIEGAPEYAFDIAVNLDQSFFSNLNWNVQENYASNLAKDIAVDLELYRSLIVFPYISEDPYLSNDLELYLNRLLMETFTLYAELQGELKILKDRLAARGKSWWRVNDPGWIEQLRSVMIEYRNIGHDWQSSDEQKERLQQYYDANKLLVDCLNSDCYVSRELRQEIEETLLLPIAEIKKRRSCRNDGVMGECNKNDEKT